MVTTTVFCGVTKAPAPFPLPLCRHTSPTWQYGALTTPERSAEHPTEIMHSELSQKNFPNVFTWKCRQAGALLRQNRKSLGTKLQLVGSKLMSLMWAKGDSGNLQTRGKKKDEITNSSKSIQINPNHHSHHHCFNLQTKISSNRGTKPRAFHLPNEHTGHKPSPAERHPVLHPTFTSHNDDSPRSCMSSKCFKRPRVSKPDDVSR